MKKALILFPRLLMLLSFSFLFIKCNKDDDPGKTTTDLLVGNWVMTSDNFSPPIGSPPVSELFPFYDACFQDDVYVINANGTGEWNEGATKCDPGDPQSSPFNWALKNNNTVLTLSETLGGATVSYDYEILQLDATTLKLKNTFDDSGVTYTNTTTYTRK
jgi:hypothetical protein